MEKENKTGNPEWKNETKAKGKTEAEKPESQPEEAAQESAAPKEEPAADLGKFKSVEALVRAYRELEAEFTRRSQKLKALEEAQTTAPQTECAPREDELYREVTANEGVRTRVVNDYLSSLKGVPLMTGGGAGAKAPSKKPKSIREAGSLALGYLRNQTNNL